jgi:hypothetical protein
MAIPVSIFLCDMMLGFISYGLVIHKVRIIRAKILSCVDIIVFTRSDVKI